MAFAVAAALVGHNSFAAEASDELAEVPQFMVGDGGGFYFHSLLVDEPVEGLLITGKCSSS